MDIIEMLIRASYSLPSETDWFDQPNNVCTQAAREIERLRDEVEALREELETTRGCKEAAEGGCDDVLEELAEVRNEVETLKEDAERWRIVRTTIAGFITRDHSLIWLENPELFDLYADSVIQVNQRN